MHISHELLELMQCPACRGGDLRLGAERYPRLRCRACGVEYPVVDGIPDMVPPQLRPEPGSYRTETLHSLVANVYDLLAPAMSLAVWRCSPLRYVDSENRALGRANGGVYLRAPVSTGLGIGGLLARYHDLTIVGVDRSWPMLRRAERRLRDAPNDVHLVRADYRALPFRDGAIRCVQSFNGLQTFDDRSASIREFLRCIEDGGFLSGTALIRGQRDLADIVLARFERAGIYPLLRSAEFLLAELEETLGEELHLQYETHGAAMFFAVEITRAYLRVEGTGGGDDLRSVSSA
jgi:ubiquinone/menaquinone biosynthesis C-methylase UbiE